MQCGVLDIQCHPFSKDLTETMSPWTIIYVLYREVSVAVAIHSG